MINKSYFKILLIPIFCLPAIACKGSDSSQTSRRVYICFSNTLKPEQKNGFSISAKFSSRDNKNEIIECNQILNNGKVSSVYSNTTIWYCDVPKFAEISTMELKYHNAVYSTLGPYRMNSVFFNWSATGYSEYSIDKETGWVISNLSIIDYCEYVLSKIDPFSDSTFFGYNSYPYLLDSFHNSLSKEEKETLSFITWYDEAYKREISAKDKWTDIENQYRQNFVPENIVSSVFFYIFGIILLVLVVCFTIVLLVPKFREKLASWLKKRKWIKK